MSSITIGSSQMPYKRFLKLFVTWSPGEKLLRLGRLVWANGEPGKPGGGYTAKLSLGLTPSLFRWRREWEGWVVVLCGVHLHYSRSYGGWMQ